MPQENVHRPAPCEIGRIPSRLLPRLRHGAALRAIGQAAFAGLFAATLTLSLSACATLRAPSADVVRANSKIDSRPRIAVATAYAPELAALFPDLENAAENRLNGVSFWTGELSGQPVVLFKTGVSLVNATMNTQLLLDHFNITHILVSGVAGGLDPALSIGDVTVPAKWAQYNEGAYLRETSPGQYAPHPGVEPILPAFEFMGTRAVRIARDADPDPKPKLWFEADPRLLAIAEKAAGRVNLQQCDDDGLCLPQPPKVVPGGAGVSGSIFMDNRRFREYLFDTFDAQVVEMETAAIAMVAYANHIPYIAFRSLSDLAGGGQAEQNEITAFEHLAARNAAALVHEYLQAYGEDDASAAVASGYAAIAGADDVCEIHYSTIPYEPQPLGEARTEKLRRLVSAPGAQEDFLNRFNDLSYRIAGAMAPDRPFTETADLHLVWGGYNGAVSPSLSMELAMTSPEDRALATRIGAGLGYVFFQQSVAVECMQPASGMTEAAALVLEEQGVRNLLSAEALPSVYGMMIGQAGGDTNLGFTYYPETDKFLVLGLRDAGASDKLVMDKVLRDLVHFAPEAGLELVESTRWIQFPYNDWLSSPNGEAYIAAGLTEGDLAKLDALRAEYLSLIDALPVP